MTTGIPLNFKVLFPPTNTSNIVPKIYLKKHKAGNNAVFGLRSP
jgi:hypothetical protein